MPKDRTHLERMLWKGREFREDEENVGKNRSLFRDLRLKQTMRTPSRYFPRISLRPLRKSRDVLILSCGLLALASPIQGQQDTLVEAREGRLITSMGQPSPWGYFVAGDVGLAPVDTREFSGQFSLGFERSLLNPLMSILSVTGEYFMGFRGNGRGQVGFRGGLEIPIARVGAGWQYDFRTADDRPYLSLRHPLRRGGVFWPGGQARILWTPGKDQSLTLGVTVPVSRPFAGRTRPQDVKARIPLPLAAEPPDSDPLSERVRSLLDEARLTALRLARLHVPYLGPPTESAYERDGAVARAVQALAVDLGIPEGGFPAEGPVVNVPEETVRSFHRTVESAFQDVSIQTGMAESVFGAAARRAILDEVIFPYNRLIGRKKAGDTYDQLAARARVAFARELVLARGLDESRIVVSEAVFNAILEIVRGVKDRQVTMWGDDRLAFLPPQLALLPEEHDSQGEIDALLGRAVGNPFSEGNRAWYAVNEDFEYELLRMIQDTRRYHILWIHDIRGFDDQGDPDAVAYRTVLEGYLDALADRVEAYDQEGALPVYLIIIDEWFYEANQGRLWLSLLEDPMGYELDLPEGFDSWEAEIRQAQDRLRRAVTDSRLLQAEAREYGEEWLQNRIRVQVNVTNPADPTFWSWELFPWIGMPDALIRDHRKISFFDVDPRDPYRGRALYTGMGVGEHYNGPTWDDRAVLVQGPMLRSLREAARDLLLQQGFDPADLPYPLQDGTSPYPDLDQTVPERGMSGLMAGRMMQAHNLIGYGEKSATVLKATLYALMPPGAVAKSPDSLWNFPLWASLLTGHALRGGRVMAVAPSSDNAPADAFGSMALAENVLSQMVLAGRELGPAIDRAGGLLKVGMYAPRVGVGDIPGKARSMAENYQAHPWLAELHGVETQDIGGLEAFADSLEATGFRARYLEGDALSAPKLHMKVHFFATREGWDPLMAQPEADEFLLAYLKQRATQLSEVGQDRDLRQLQNAMAPFTDGLRRSWARNTEPEAQEHAAWFLMVGSQNQNFRSALLDGEVLVAVAGPEAVIGLADQMLILGLCEWLENPEELKDHFLPISGIMRRIGLWARFIF